MNDSNIAITRGYNMAFGVFSEKLLQIFYPEILDVVILNCLPKGKESDDAETRKQAIKSLVQIVQTLGFVNLTNEERLKILETFYKGYDDYAVDRRGDVGSWVRQESMFSLRKYVHMVACNDDKEIQSFLGADKC